MKKSEAETPWREVKGYDQKVRPRCPEDKLEVEMEKLEVEALWRLVRGYDEIKS
jgi:hypothetical protein